MPPLVGRLRPLDDAGVVAVDAFGHLARLHVQELRIGPQQLRRGSASLARQRAGSGVAEERVRHQLVEHRAPSARYFGSSWLMLTDRVVRAAERQMIAARADVADGDGHRAGQLALEVG